MAVIELTKENFDKEVIECDKPVLIDFWASWCAPCRMLSPTVDEIDEEREDIKVCKVNVDKQNELAGAFRVSSIPMLVLIKDKKIVNTNVGVIPKESILKMLEI